MNEKMTERALKLTTIYRLSKHFDIQFDENLAADWVSLLDAYTGAEVAAGGTHLIKNYQYKAPHVAHLIAAIDHVLGVPSAEKARELGASLAWHEVKAAAQKYGLQRKPAFDDTTERAVERIGWEKICMTSESQSDWIEKTFCRVWQDCAEYAALLDQPREVLLGIALGKNHHIQISIGGQPNLHNELGEGA